MARMQMRAINANPFLAVLVLLVTVFLLSVVSVSGKSALGLPEFKNHNTLENPVFKALITLEKTKNSRYTVLEISDVPEGNTPPKTNTTTQPWKYENRIDVTHRTADDVNKIDFDNGYKPPYKPGTQVTEFTVKSDDVFVRVHNVENPNRPWMMRKEAVEGLTAEQIQRKYSLPSKPSYISEVHVPAGTRMRTGKVEPNFEIQGGGGSGATQYEWLNTRVPKTAIKNTRPLN